MTDSLATPRNTPKSLTVCVVAHTHWDREWYHSASRFRQQLVALVDALLARAEQDAFPFLLDGQAVVLEDYLAVRPEVADRLRTHLQSGEIEAGPWYVLADGLIPSGEAMVRNLLAGRRILRRFGAVSPAVAYCPDTFGHAAAIPAIAHEFGFPLAIVWRGFGGARWPTGDVMRWRAANGASVLMYHLPPDGYETGSALPAEQSRAESRWSSLQALMNERSTTGVVLLPNGADHHALQPRIREAIDALQSAVGDNKVLRESLSGFTRRLADAVASRNDPLPIVEGELRDSYGYTWTLNGTFGTRASQKRANAKAERLLLRDVEPWLALAWLHGKAEVHCVAENGSITLAQTPALLDAAWRTLLRAHPHDTLCGCSIDAVARAMEVRIESSVAQARGLRSAALNMALQRDVVSARSAPLSGETKLVVRNRCARWRGGVAEVLLDETLGDVPVGPSSAAIAISRSENVSAVAARPEVEGFPLQVINSRDVYRRRESPQQYPDNDRVRAHRALVWVPPVPPIGVAVHGVRFVRLEELEQLGSEQLAEQLGSEPQFGTTQNVSMSRAENRSTELGSEPNFGTTRAELMPDSVQLRVIGDDIELSNSLLKVTIGLLGVHVMRAGRTLRNALSFETASDVGDSYTPAIRGEPEMLRIVSAKPGASGPLRASAVIQLQTSAKNNRIRVRAIVSLDAGADAVRVEITGNNQRRNHRLRVNFNSDVVNSSSAVDVWADAAFGPVQRPLQNIPAHDQTREMVPPTMPMHRWATMCDAENGATFHSDGLAEIETNRATGTMSLTLLRAIGELSRNDLPERPGHAGWPAAIPMAQSLGVFHARIALQLHRAWSQQTRDEIETASDALLLPLVGETIRDTPEAPELVTGPELSGTALRASTIAQSDSGNAIVLRCVNDSSETQGGVWKIDASASFEFARSNLSETVEDAWRPLTDCITFDADPRAIVTFLVRRRNA